MMRVAIDLLWVRHKKVGGIESYIRNLLDGFSSLDDEFEFTLLVSHDNCDSFKHYEEDIRFKIYECDINSENVYKRILWQNFNLGRIIRRLEISICFEPYYCKPVFGCKNIKFITTIHDLQALHYPEYFSKFKNLWMRFSWYMAVSTSERIVAISNYVKDDILKKYTNASDKVVTIYNPVAIDPNEFIPFTNVKDKYGILESQYFFTVSSLLPHKNLETIINVIDNIKTNNINLPKKLIISGIGGSSAKTLGKIIVEKGLEENVILTPFIDNNERNTLYKYCKAFLFPSVFEGFGMPPVEAMILGVPVITTRKACLEEVTLNGATYVENPFNVNEWIEKIENKPSNTRISDFSMYDKCKISKDYLNLFSKIH